MTTRKATWMTALTVIAALASPSRTAAQHQRSAPYPYILIDLGTFGGPNTYLDLPGQTTNASGTVIADADTPMSDPNAPNCLNPDCFVSVGLVWQHGIRTRLDSLPDGSNNAPFSINASGLVAGFSQDGVVDPLTGIEEGRAVLWKDGRILDLGTLPGGRESIAFVVNDRGMVAGPASNAVPDPYSCAIFFWCGTQIRAVLWQDGAMKDLGTLGGPDSLPLFINNRGQIAGQSFTSATANPDTGLPTLDPFLWENGQMRDLGSLGGTLGDVNAMNGRGEVVGDSFLAGDQTLHPFLWDGQSLKDLGTLGGTNGRADAINEAGDVVGSADLPDSQTHHGFLWSNGVMTDLGSVNGDACSHANAINARGQVVGSSTDCRHNLTVFLWEHGSSVDVSTLVAPSALHMTFAAAITNQGEIVGIGSLPNGNQHVMVLVPAGLAESEGLTSNAPAPGTTGPASGPRTSATPCATALPWRTPLAAWRARLAQRHQPPCLGG